MASQILKTIIFLLLSLCISSFLQRNTQYQLKYDQNSIIQILNSKQDLMNSLKAESNTVAASIPPNTINVLISMTELLGWFVYDEFPISSLNDIMANKYEFPDNIQNNLRIITIAESTDFQTFNFQVKSGEGCLEEYLITARHTGGQVELAYIHVVALGNLQSQFTYVTKQECHKVFFFFKKCHDVQVAVPRGYTTDELQRILNALRGSAYNKVIEQINNPTYPSLYSLGPVIYADARINQFQYLESGNHEYYAIMQGDGNFVVYKSIEFWPSNAYFASNTNGRSAGPYFFACQGDGNLVVYDRNSQPLWSSKTNLKGRGPYRLIMQDDANLVLYDANNSPIWALW